MNINAIIVPGNGNDSPDEGWKPYVVRELGKLGVEVTNVKFPDALLARKEYWLPFLEKLGANENTILIGYSSGAIAAIRYAEDRQLFGTVLVGAYYTDLNMESEKESGYFDEEWSWGQAKQNQQWIIQFHSTDDPYIPTEEAHYVRDKFTTEYHEFSNRGHFNQTEFPELVEAVKGKLV